MFFTVFTPTYNRAKTLYRVYDSLKSQNYKDFEWLIIDDGSTDNTNAIINKWKKENFLKIRYYKKKNEGKHIAINLASKISKGLFLLIADSDDSFPTTSLSTFKKAWDTIPKKLRKDFSGVCGLCEDEYGKIIGNTFKKSPFDSCNLDIIYKYKIKGEKWAMVKTEIMKKYQFPKDKELNFVFESFIWNKIAKKFKTRYINKVVRTYYKSEVSLSNIGLEKKIPSRAIYSESLENDINYFVYAPLTILKIAIQSVRFSFHYGDSLYIQFSRLKKTKSNIVLVFAILPGIIIYFLDKILKIIKSYSYKNSR